MNENLPKGALPTDYELFDGRGWTHVEDAVVEEIAVCIHVNGEELATIMASPLEQKAMALGFLRGEGFLTGLEEIEAIDLVGGGTCVDVWLAHEVERPRRTIHTSGCGGGVTFDDLTAVRRPLPLGMQVSAEQVSARYHDLRGIETLYPITRGIHASALCTPEQVLMVAEDVGRHNTLDKLWGKAMLQGLETAGRFIITTGRISSEMLGKAAKMGVPLVASRTSPTSRSLAFARAWNITVIGYLRQRGMRVYTAPERVLAAEAVSAKPAT